MGRYIPKELRRFVIERANKICEYCLIQEEFSFFEFHIEHIISVKHGGETIEENLAYACAVCNREKGTDLGTFMEDTSTLIRFYNPRIDVWNKHFKIQGAEIISLTKIGGATVKILKLNTEHRRKERKSLIEIGAYPSENAKKIMNI